MKHVLSVCAVLLALPLLFGAGAGPEPTETVVRMKVQPMAAPKPSLRYQLLPELRELNPGNPILGYLRCFMEQNGFFFNKEALAQRDQLATLPLKELPLDNLRGYGGIALRQADAAARLEMPDWQVLRKLKKEGIYLLVPDIQQLRRLAWALKVRFRIEVAGKRFLHANTTAKTMFALARHLAEHPTMIGDLVGIGTAQWALEPLEEMIEQPGCPNLFWALTDLPRPFIDLRKGVQGDRVALAALFAELDDKTPMSDARLARVVENARQLEWVSSKKDAPKKNVRAWLDERIKDETHVRAAQKRLIESGLAADRVKRFPALQIVLLDEKRALEVLRDEVTRGITLPYWQWETDRLGGATQEENRDGLFKPYAQAVANVRKAQARLEQRFALLRCVEALRMYTADHRGRLPTKLSDIHLPLPVDPITGRAFTYHLEGTTAYLHGTPPRGMEKIAAYNVRYEITLRK
jgi:hypothetical protein